MNVFGVNWLDWLVIAAYLVGITIIGSWTVKRVKSSASFFISDRKFGKIMMMFFTFGTGTHTGQAVLVASKSFRSGASGIWYEWLWLFCTPFFWLFAPMFRRMRAVTTGDFFHIRYGRSVSILYALVGALQQMVNIGVMLKGSSAMITAVSGGKINPSIAIWSMTAMFVIYGISGGLSAAIVTDFVQGLLTIVLSFLILPSAWHAVGGISHLRTIIHDPAMFKIVAPSEITAFYITIISLNALIGWVTLPHSMALSGAGKTELEGRVGVMCGIMMKRLCTIAWAITGLCGMGMYLGQKLDPDQVYGLMAGDLLPKLAPGLIGLFIAGMLAAVMSSCDAFMVTSAALFTENIYKPVLAPGRPDSHYVKVGRLASALVVLFGIIFAYRFETVVEGMEVFWKVAAMMGIPFFVGLFWRRATTAAAWVSTLTSFAAWLFTSPVTFFGKTFWDFNAHFADKLPSFMLFDGKLSLPWQMIIYLTVGFIPAILVSLFTKPQDKEKLDKFYNCLRTPVVPNEPETEPFTLPPGMTPGPRKVLIDHPDFEIPKPAPITIIGFLAGWAAVAALILLFYGIMKL